MVARCHWKAPTHWLERYLMVWKPLKLERSQRVISRRRRGLIMQWISLAYRKVLQRFPCSHLHPERVSMPLPSPLVLESSGEPVLLRGA